MIKESNKHEDQAVELRKLFNEVQQGGLTNKERTGEIVKESDKEPDEEIEKAIEEKEKEKEIYIDIGMDSERGGVVDILNLPPRKEIHSKNGKRTRVKMRRPFMRLIFVIVIILGILSGLYYVWGEELLNLL